MGPQRRKVETKRAKDEEGGNKGVTYIV